MKEGKRENANLSTPTSLFFFLSLCRPIQCCVSGGDVALCCCHIDASKPIITKLISAVFSHLTTLQ